MQFIAILAIFANLCSVEASYHGRRQLFPSQDDMWSEFKNFMQKFSKNYETANELQSRFEIFRTNLRTIILHNTDTTQNFTMGINAFADLTPAEFKEKYLSGLQSKQDYGAYLCKSYSSLNSGSLPSSVDWRSHNAVTPVKDQGQCGSCWSFSASGALEGAWAISTGKLVSMSEQALVDCASGVSYGSHGCNGGQMDGAFKYAIEKGMCSESSYPYVSGDTKTAGTCHTCSSVAHFSSCSDVTPKNQALLKQAVAQQPVAIAIEADTRYFQLYSGGVLTSSSCGTNLDHGVLIVGYGTENGIDYWLVKNSWGESWGESGYVKIARSDSTNDAGICGVAMEPSFPSV
jgi:C1A family cysteine protease